jgi:Predicted endonuclease involved in recombination (possible Holliday junction resolvase in Mycoplasmas and B. subtilis)
MAVIDILAMKAALAPGGRLFGLDIGSKTIGIAVSDSALKVAPP